MTDPILGLPQTCSCTDAPYPVELFVLPRPSRLGDDMRLLMLGEGRNLDRHLVSIDSGGRITIDTSKRECSVRTARAASSPVSC